MSEINTWQELRDAVGKWSVANFGSQRGLGCLAPLLGMCEEVGELESADTPEDREDALGDILIFLMDYCYRAGVDMQGVYLVCPGTVMGLSVAVGRLHHIQLKRIQRIRGMDDTPTFRSAQWGAVLNVIASVDHFMPVTVSAFDLATKVWNTVVSKRQWKDCTSQPTTRDQCLYDFNAVLGELHQGL